MNPMKTLIVASVYWVKQDLWHRECSHVLDLTVYGRLTLWSMLTEKRGSMAFTSSLFLWAWNKADSKRAFQIKQFFPQKDGTLQSKWSFLAGNYHQQLNTDLAQGTVGLLIKEFDLICSRAGLFVRKTPGHLREEVTCWQISDFVLLECLN